MDAKALGAFVAELRKEHKMTQAELAARLNVTDKAVSRWERGLGFPDINTLEPLADVLGVSLAELMKCQRLSEESVNLKEATTMVESGIDIAKYQREVHRKRIIRSLMLCLIGVIIIIVAVYIHSKLFISLSVSVLEYSDGPTTIFTAGRIGDFNSVIIAVIGVVFIGVGIWRLCKNIREVR